LANHSDINEFAVVETFHSLQGEGFHSGRSAFFIRLAGCSVGCSWCDTKQSWPEAAHPQRSSGSLALEASQAIQNGAAFTVITGGEPLHHDLKPLTTALKHATHSPIHLETSGVDPLSGCLDWITLSPKPHHPPRRDVLLRCDELKVIVHTATDLQFAEAMTANISERTVLLLQPGWNSNSGQALVVDYVKHHPQWRLSLQTHKWLGVR
tara:strand:+ start:2080 stop:2706 length:627 start_codon:yes stop_codon:yes gene_type:complete